jgi:hypothetical protein
VFHLDLFLDGVRRFVLIALSEEVRSREDCLRPA